MSQPRVSIARRGNGFAVFLHVADSDHGVQHVALGGGMTAVEARNNAARFAASLGGVIMRLDVDSAERQDQPTP